MTKAATHLLWNDHFTLIRGWLVDHTDWMVSDSTGIPPGSRSPAGYMQDTYGTFDGPAPFGTPDARDASDLKHLFASEPTRDLPFRYGYPDKARSRPHDRDAPLSRSAEGTGRLGEAEPGPRLGRWGKLGERRL